MSAKPVTPVRGTRYAVHGHFAGHEDVDWETVGTAMVNRLVEEVAAARMVDSKVSRGCRFQYKKVPSAWEFDYEKHGVQVFKKKSGKSRFSFMGRGVINKPMNEVAEFLKRVENNLSWDKLLTEAKYLLVLSETPNAAEYIGYQHFESKVCLVNSKRDMLYYMKCVHQEERYVQAALSIRDPEYPTPAGVKRIEVGLGSGFVIEKYNGSSTLVTYVGDLDLKGLPVFAMNLAVKRCPMAVYYIRNQMTVQRYIVPDRRSSVDTLSRTHDKNFQKQDHDDFYPGFEEEVTATSYGKEKGSKYARRTSEGQFSDCDEHFQIDLPDDFVPGFEEAPSSYEQSIPIEHFTMNSQ